MNLIVMSLISLPSQFAGACQVHGRYAPWQPSHLVPWWSSLVRRLAILPELTPRLRLPGRPAPCLL